MTILFTHACLNTGNIISQLFSNNHTSFRIYAYICNLTYIVQIFLTFHVIAAKTSSPAIYIASKENSRPRSLASTACDGLAIVHVRVSSGTMIRPTIDRLESAHRDIQAQVNSLWKIGVAHASM